MNGGDEFQDIYLKFFRKNEKKHNLINNIASEINIALALSFVNKRANKKNVSHFEEKFKRTLVDIFADLKDYREFSSGKVITPTAVKNKLKTVRGALETLEKIWKEEPLIETLLELVLNESSNPKLVNPEEVSFDKGDFLNKSLYRESITTVENVKISSKVIIEEIAKISPVVSSDLILAARLERYSHDKRILLNVCYNFPNKILLIITYHFYFFCNEVGLDTKNSKAEFISLVTGWINQSLSEITSSERITKKTRESIIRLGNLSRVSKNTITELFRSSSWESLLRK